MQQHAASNACQGRPMPRAWERRGATLLCFLARSSLGAHRAGPPPRADERWARHGGPIRASPNTGIGLACPELEKARQNSVPPAPGALACRKPGFPAPSPPLSCSPCNSPQRTSQPCLPPLPLPPRPSRPRPPRSPLSTLVSGRWFVTLCDRAARLPDMIPTLLTPTWLT